MAERSAGTRRNALTDLRGWKAAPKPGPVILEGAYVRLEPLDPARHAGDLFAAAGAPGAEDRFRYLAEDPPADLTELRRWAEKAAVSDDPLFFAVIDKSTGRAEGRQALMRIDPDNGVAEIGHIMWGPAIARTRAATEALFLVADHVFGLGYRRFEWKCNDRNLPSKRAAERFGFSFEGLFRQHMVVKGESRDTAWFSILDGEWPRLREGYGRWLRPGNFDASGRQMSKLAVGP